ncbi:MAG: hypothetical protein ACOX6T_19160 [Myxococcales bacterium]
MQASTPERFVVAVHSGHSIDEKDWRGSFRSALGGRGLRLGEDGQIWRELHGGPLSVGSYRLLDPDEASAAFPGAPWLKMEPCCPFVGRLAGFLTWTPFVVWEPPRAGVAGLSEIVVAILKEARGLIARVADDRIAHPIREASFDLSDLTNRWGFGDGELFLAREEGDYSSYACKTVEAALKAEGLSGHVQWVGTSHNNLRLGWVEVPSRLRSRLGLAPKLVPALWRTRGDRLVLVRNAKQELTGKSMKLWAFDFSVADDRAFWEPAEANEGTQKSSA